MAKVKSKSKTKAKKANSKTKAAKAARKLSKSDKKSAKKSAKTKSKSKTGKTVKAPGWRVTCTSLAEIRANIDRLDTMIVPLLCERLHFVTQAANFKPSVAGVVVPARVEQIISLVRAMAEKFGTRPETIETVYRALIDAFTADEQRHWAELHKVPRLSDKW